MIANKLSLFYKAPKDSVLADTMKLTASHSRREKHSNIAAKVMILRRNENKNY